MSSFPVPQKSAFFKIPDGYLTGLLAGLAMGLTRLHPVWAPLQIPALAVLGWELSRATGIVGRLRPGAWFGAAMAALVLGNIGVPLPAACILFVAMTLFWTGMGAAISIPLGRRDLAGALGAAGILAIGEWAQALAMPLFGTAQRFANAWVEYDVAMPVSRLGGTTLITFVACAVSFGIALLIRSRACTTTPRRNGEFSNFTIIGAIVTAIAAILCGLGYWLTLSEDLNQGAQITVAVCGSKSPDGAFMDEDRFLKKYRPMVAVAAAQGAKLVVTPEMGLFVKDSDRDATLARIAGEAEKLGVTWTVGYAQSLPSLNRAVILNAGAVKIPGQETRSTSRVAVGESYDKTHWVPFMEKYARHGDARAITGEVGDTKIGLMICQDDNYEVVARNLSLAGARIATVPTFDWAGVEHAHLNSARNRPREFGFVEARAAIGGISAIIDPTGKVLATRNHLVEGDGFALAQVNIDGGSPTLFAKFGNLPILLLSGLFALNALRRKSKTADPQAAPPVESAAPATV